MDSLLTQYHNCVLSGIVFLKTGDLTIECMQGTAIVNGNSVNLDQTSFEVSKKCVTDIWLDDKGQLIQKISDDATSLPLYKDKLRLYQIYTDLEGITAIYDLRNRHLRIKNLPNSYYTMQDLLDNYRITDGIYKDCFSATPGGGIVWYFSNNAFFLLCESAAYDQYSIVIYQYIIKAFEKLVISYSTNKRYLKGMFCTAAGFIWQAKSAGTSSNNSPFNGTYKLGYILKDNDIEWEAVYKHYGGHNYFWLDTNPDGTVKAPDSHDSYAASLCSLIYRYCEMTNYGWLTEVSIHGNSHIDILRNIVFHNMMLPINDDDRTLVFQGGISPVNGGGNNSDYLMDNCEVFDGFISFANICLELEDIDGEQEALMCASTIKDGIDNLYDDKYDLFRWVGSAKTEDMILDNTAARNTYWLAQYFIDYLVFDDIQQFKRDNARKYADSLFPDSEDDNSRDIFIMLIPTYTLLKRYGNKERAIKALNYVERYKRIYDLSIQQMGLYLAIKGIL